MKCVCGYEYFMPDSDKAEKIGDEEFDCFETMKKVKHFYGSEYNVDIQAVYLFSCPVCHTVRTEG